MVGASADKPASTAQAGSRDLVLQALRRIVRAIELHSRFLVTKYGLTGPQLTVLRVIAEEGPLATGCLARSVQLSSATVTGIVSRLEARQLVERTRSANDKRCVLVSITPAGATLLKQAPPPLQEHFTAAFERLQDWEQSQILCSLQRLVAMMEARDLPASSILATGPLEAGAEETKAFLATDLDCQELPPPAGSAAYRSEDN